MKLDKWQQEVLDIKGNLCLCSGRQVGKSTVIAIKAGESAVKSKKTIMIIAAVERQAFLLFEKVLSHIYINHKKMICKGKDRPTKSKLKLTNGSIIHCLPTGDSGYGIRGYTINELYADEAHFINDDVWAAVTPMLATTGGRINLLSTPDLTKGKSGYFYRCSMDKDFKFFSVSHLEVAETRSEPQRTNMLEHAEKERKRLSKAQFAAEYLGTFVDAMLQFFSNKWIEKVCTVDEHNFAAGKGDNFLGVDVAGMGADESTFETLKGERDNLTQVGHEITTKTRTTETTAKILNLERLYYFNKIGLDDGGMGVGVYDQLLREDSVKTKIEALNNSSRSIDSDDKRKKLLKEDMYNNLLVMGERGELHLFDNDEIKQSLRCIHSDPEASTFKLFGSHSHITEGLIRAAWCAKNKSLKPYIY